jgi:hypothetical protein
MVGSLFGIILANKTSMVNRVYQPDNFLGKTQAQDSA